MRGFLNGVHFVGLFVGGLLTADALGNLQTAGHNVIAELSVALVALVLSFTAYTVKNRF